MNDKNNTFKIISVLFATAIIIVAIVSYTKNKNNNTVNQAQNTEIVGENSTPDVSNIPVTTNPISNNPTKIAKPVEPTKSITAPNTYTLATVATHNSSSNCWTTVNGNVYDVTNWISQHPGGSSAIMRLCGKDGTDTFNGKHGGQPRPASELASFKIGTLAK